MDALRLRPAVTNAALPIRHGVQANSLRFSAGATADTVSITPQATLEAKAVEDVRFYVTRMKDTMANLVVQYSGLNSQGNSLRKPDVIKLQAIIGETGKHLEARLSSNRDLEAKFQPPYNNMPHHEVIRVSSQNSVGMWQIDSTQNHHPKEGYTYTTIMPRSAGLAVPYDYDQYRPLIAVENTPRYRNRVTYRFPWSGDGYDHIVQKPVEITDPALKKEIIGLAQRLLDKMNGINVFQRIHRLAKFGYWTP